MVGASPISLAPIYQAKNHRVLRAFSLSAEKGTPGASAGDTNALPVICLLKIRAFGAVPLFLYRPYSQACRQAENLRYPQTFVIMQLTVDKMKSLVGCV